MDKSKWKGRGSLILIILLCLLPSLLCMLHKTQLHVDEVWTYALSNSADRPYLYVWRTGIGDKSAPLRFSPYETALLDTEGVFLQQWHSGEEFKRYITVQEGERFQYSSVVYNQTCDVHPPLYYFIVHTICSFFPDSFSVWYAFLPNLVFLIGSLFLLYCIAIRLGANRLKALLTVLFWGISRAGISDAVFLRMYMMLTFITLLSVYVHARFYEFHRGRYIILIFFINLAGFLTQYYYYIFCFFLTAVFCIYFLIRRKTKLAIIYGCSVLGSVGLAVFLFPAVLDHVFRGAYTESSTIHSDSFQRLFSWVGILVKDFVGTFSAIHALILVPVLFVFIFLLTVYLVLGFLRHKWFISDVKDKMSALFHRRSTLYWLILLIAALSGFLLGLVSPIMPKYQDRYYFNILAILAIYFVDLLMSAFSKLLSRGVLVRLRLPLMVAALAVLTLSSNLSSRNNYIDYDRNSTSLAASLENETCFLVLHQDLRVHVYPIYLQKAENVYVSHGIDDQLLSEINSFQGNRAYILVQFSRQYPNAVKELVNGANYQVSVLDFNIETTLGYMDNDALLLVDYTKPK